MEIYKKEYGFAEYSSKIIIKLICLNKEEKQFLNKLINILFYNNCILLQKISQIKKEYYMFKIIIFVATSKSK